MSDKEKVMLKNKRDPLVNKYYITKYLLGIIFGVNGGMMSNKQWGSKSQGGKWGK